MTEENLKDCSPTSSMDNVASFDIDAGPASTRLTGIICTIGPASHEVDVLVDMIEAGMNVLRLNLQSGSHEYHADTIRYARETITSLAEEDSKVTGVLAIALDTKGPQIRTGVLKEGSDVELEKGQKIKITADPAYAEQCTNEMLFVDYKKIASVLAPKNKIYIDDDLIQLEVKIVDSGLVECEVIAGGQLGNNMAVHFPGVKIDLPTLSEKDRMDIMFAVENEVDMIFASGIKNAASVQEVRKVLGEEGKYIKVISKIENREGIKHIDEIIKASDGIMIGSGCLGIDLPLEKVFLAQKMIIAKCNIAGKAVIGATQMMDSMIKKPRPTRAESCDIANAVVDGADCVMLCCETAEGDYPVESVATMHAICLEAEAAISHRALFNELVMKTKAPADILTSTAIAAVEVALNSQAPAIIVLTSSGSSARTIAKYRPPCPILAVTRDSRLARQILIHRAVVPLVFEGEKQSDYYADVDKRVQFAIKYAKERNIVKSEDNVVVVSKSSKDINKDTDTVRLLQVE